MFDNSKCLSQNPLKNSTYIGKDVGLLKNRIFYDTYKIEDDIIMGEGLKSDKPLNNYYKLSNIYNYIIALSNVKRKNEYEKCIELFKCIGVPASSSLDQKNKYMKLDPLDIDITTINSTIDMFNDIKALSSNSFDKSSIIRNTFMNTTISFIAVKNPTLVTDYISIPTSSNIFKLAAYYCIKMQPFSIDSHFICSECGNVYLKDSNKIRFCKSCKEKIDFPKISHNKK